VFVDLEKAFDRVPRKVIEWALRRKRIPERMVAAVMALYVDSRSRVKTMAVISKWFHIVVGVHQGSVLSPLLFITVMDEVVTEVRKGVPWELMFADDLALTAESKQEVMELFERWRNAMELKGLKVNMEKTKLMVTGKESTRRVQSGRWSCGCCGKGVGVNSILCVDCNNWCHLRCSGLRKVSGVHNFQCPSCRKGNKREEVEKKHYTTTGERIEEVEEFCYLGNVLDCEAGVERAVSEGSSGMEKMERDGEFVNKRKYSTESKR
jgi:hypothetical protein